MQITVKSLSIFSLQDKEKTSNRIFEIIKITSLNSTSLLFDTTINRNICLLWNTFRNLHSKRRRHHPMLSVQNNNRRLEHDSRNASHSIFNNVQVGYFRQQKKNKTFRRCSQLGLMASICDGLVQKYAKSIFRMRRSNLSQQDTCLKLRLCDY